MKPPPGVNTMPRFLHSSSFFASAICATTSDARSTDLASMPSVCVFSWISVRITDTGKDGSHLVAGMCSVDWQ